MHPWLCLLQPGAEAILLPIVGTHEEHVGGLDEQRSQILAAPLGETSQNWSPAGAVLPRYEAEPGAEVAPPFERFARSDRCDHGGRDQRADAGNGLQPRTVRFALADQLDV